MTVENLYIQAEKKRLQIKWWVSLCAMGKGRGIYICILEWKEERPQTALVPKEHPFSDTKNQHSPSTVLGGASEHLNDDQINQI